MSEVCSCCDSVVYSAEKAAISGKKGDVYHKKCMKCCVCSKRLDSITFNEHDGNVFIYIYISVPVSFTSLSNNCGRSNGKYSTFEN